MVTELHTSLNSFLPLFSFLIHSSQEPATASVVLFIASSGIFWGLRYSVPNVIIFEKCRETQKKKENRKIKEDY
jgi:hypothetical protein